MTIPLTGNLIGPFLSAALGANANTSTTLQNESNWTVTLRMHKDFLP